MDKGKGNATLGRMAGVIFRIVINLIIAKFISAFVAIRLELAESSLRELVIIALVFIFLSWSEHIFIKSYKEKRASILKDMKSGKGT